MNNLHPSIQNWLDTRTEEKRGLYLFGTTGTGKTHNLKILHEKNKKKDGKIKYYSVPNFLDEIARLRQQLSADNSQFGYISSRLDTMLSGKKAVILDDLGTETLSERKLEDLYRLINGMYEDKRTLIISSNLSVAELERKLGDRICSRIVEMCHLVELTGEDRRFK